MLKSPNNTFQGTIFACTAAALGGSTFVFTRLILPSLDPYLLCFVRYLSILIVLTCFCGLGFLFKKYETGDIFKLIFLGVIYFGGFPIFVALGLETTNASNASLVFATMPIWTVLLSFVFKLEKMTLIKQFSVVIACSGVYFAVGDNSEVSQLSNLSGNLMVILGAICASFFTAFSGSFIEKYGNLPVLIITLLSGVITMFVLMLIFGENISNLLNLDYELWGTIAFLVFPGGAMMMLSWVRALELLKPVHVSICLALNPITAAILGYYLLGEYIGLEFYFGFLLIAFAIFLIQTSTKTS